MRIDPADDGSELRDAAAVHAAREAVVLALGPLAARPLDEHAAAAMRRALDRADSAEVRIALQRLGGRERRRPLALAAASGGCLNQRNEVGPPGWTRLGHHLELVEGAA